MDIMHVERLLHSVRLVKLRGETRARGRGGCGTMPITRQKEDGHKGVVRAGDGGQN